MHKSKNKSPDNLPVLLITGFGSFDEFNENPSGDLVEELDGTVLSGILIKGIRIPVSWENSWEIIQTQIDTYNPIGLLCLGLAQEACIRLEICAYNKTQAIPDVEGQLPKGWPNPNIVDNAAHFLPSSLPLDWLHAEYQRNFSSADSARLTIPIRFSKSPGSYLCNYVFYKAMQLPQERIPYRGFIHIPSYDISFEGGVTDKESIASSIQFLVKKLVQWFRDEEYI